MGGFIRIRSPLRSRSVLFDIGIAGPIAGFVVAFAVLLFSLGLSRPAPFGAVPADIQLGFPLVFYLLRYILIASAHAPPPPLPPITMPYLHPVPIAACVA